MAKGLTATAKTTIDAPRAKVWDALTDPKSVKEYMFGTNVTSDWKKGSPITFKGEWQGKKYEDKGTILEIDRERKLQYSHFSPLSGLPDKPENYHTITIDLSPDGNGTRVTLSQDNNADEKERDHSQKNWETMLSSLKKFLEK